MYRFLFILLVPFSLSAQIILTPPPGEIELSSSVDLKHDIIEFPDEEAQFKGGQIAFQQYIAKNVRYPQVSIQNNETGRVFVSFVVEKNGKISNVQVEQSVSKALDAEARRLIKTMPKWVPGKMRGTKVRTRCRVPINFTLD